MAERRWTIWNPADDEEAPVVGPRVTRVWDGPTPAPGEKVEVVEVVAEPECPPHDYQDISDGANLINVSQCERCGVITKTVPGEPSHYGEAAG